MTIFVGTKLQYIANATTVGVANTYYNVHTFSTPGSTTLTVTGSGYADVLVVGGGGIGGGRWTGGGAGGSVLYARNVPLVEGVSYPITVGGLSGSTTFNYQGGSIVASGGPAGGSGLSNPVGSGSGGNWSGGSAFGGIGANIAGLGFDGCPSSNGTGRGGGGGGAGGAAGPGGSGGVGLQYSITGTSQFYGGGGSGDNAQMNPNSSPTNFGLGGGAPVTANPGCIIIRYIT